MFRQLIWQHDSHVCQYQGSVTESFWRWDCRNRAVVMIVKMEIPRSTEHIFHIISLTSMFFRRLSWRASGHLRTPRPRRAGPDYATSSPPCHSSAQCYDNVRHRPTRTPRMIRIASVRTASWKRSAVVWIRLRVQRGRRRMSNIQTTRNRLVLVSRHDSYFPCCVRVLQS